MPTPPNLVAVILFFLALAACLWRAQFADRWHVLLCLIAAVVWGTLPIFEHSMRRSGYALVVAVFLVIAFTQPLRHRAKR